MIRWSLAWVYVSPSSSWMPVISFASDTHMLDWRGTHWRHDCDVCWLVGGRNDKRDWREFQEVFLVLKALRTDSLDYQSSSALSSTSSVPVCQIPSWPITRV